MASLFRAYNAALLKRPMLTQCLTAAVLFSGGDVLAQQFVEKRGSLHDYTRTARLAFYGGVCFGPPMTLWYQFLNRIKFASSRRAVVYRVWLDQAFLTPIAVVYFFSMMSLLEGKPYEAPDRVRSAYVPTIIRNWAVFIPAQIINFSIVPPQFRFAYVGVVSLFWNTYLSLANQEQAELEAQAAVNTPVALE
ncbi:uncharacterized protein SCHCODRAFT_02604210 [Schizophyllum commune H4-8]|nr:uncharacterized protein SCHCODRAFT_02604210 [Schizophyllum commune H4-8]KAI5899110.1 hypothetical protein SCHCODRAFT_02604210 [Schizophyllum commune H4-8]